MYKIHTNKGNKMAIRLIQTDVNGTGFYKETDEYFAYITETYGNKVQAIHSTEGNAFSSKLLFADAATETAFLSDPKVVEHRRLRDEFNVANGIITTRHNLKFPAA